MSEKLVTGYAFNLEELMEKFPQPSIKNTLKDLKDRGYHHKRDLIKDVAAYAIKLITDDIIENNVRFNLPSKQPAYFQMEGVYGEDFVKAKRNGAFLDVDPYASNFTGHIMTYNFQNQKRWVKKPVYVDHRRKKIITDKTNSGYKY